MTPLPGTATSRKNFYNSKIKNTGVGLWVLFGLSNHEANNTDQHVGDNAKNYNDGYFDSNDAGDYGRSDSSSADADIT